MPTFPTLASGAIVQFPFEKALIWRTVRTVSPGGTAAVLNDPNWRYIEWRLRFRELSQGEVNAIEQLYLESRGGLNEFTFVDPSANLLGNPGDLSSAPWQPSAVSVGVSAQQSPLDGTTVFAAAASGGLGSLSQTVSELPEITLCFSAYFRRVSGSFVRLRAGSEEREFPLSHVWRRCWVSSQHTLPQSGVEAAIVIPPGTSLLIAAPQLEAQPAPSPYKSSKPLPAIYPNTRFGGGPLKIIATGPDRYAVEFNLVTRA